MSDSEDIIMRWRNGAPTFFQTLKEYFEVGDSYTSNYKDITSGDLRDLTGIGAALLGHMQVIYDLTSPDTVQSRKSLNLLTWSAARLLDALTHILADPPKPLENYQRKTLEVCQEDTKALAIEIAKLMKRA